MKMIRNVWILAAATVASGAIVAQTSPADHAAHHPQTQAASAKETAKAPGPATAKELEDSALAMQAQMAKIHASTSAAERKALLEQHMQAMQRHFEMMKGTMGMSMGAAEGGAKGGPQGGMMNCGQMMGGDMAMMQKMMTQMQQHLEAAGPAADKKQ